MGFSRLIPLKSISYCSIWLLYIFQSAGFTDFQSQLNFINFKQTEHGKLKLETTKEIIDLPV